MNTKLYMTLELQKIQLNHIEGIWVLPLKPLSFKVYIFGIFEQAQTTIYKQDIHDKWVCRDCTFSDHDILKVLEFLKNNLKMYKIGRDEFGERSVKSKLIFDEMVKYLERK